uniref:Protein CHUP1, chloroplastic n=3 Tax=Davidia involucrata TaxID=16924 RepID=A0A5B6ZKB4_DAVIN
MKQELSPTTTASSIKPESKPSSVSSLSTTTTTTTTTPSRRLIRASFKAKDSPSPSPSPKPDAMNGGVSVSVSPSPTKLKARAKSVPRDIHNTSNTSQKTRRRALVVNKPKSGGGGGVDVDVAVVGGGSQKGRELEDVKAAGRSLNRPVVEQFAWPRRQRLTNPKRNEDEEDDDDDDDDLDGKMNNKDLLQRIDQNEIVISNLQSEVLELKAELDKVHTLNAELQSQNKKLTQDLVAAAEAKIAVVVAPTHHDHHQVQRESVAEYQSPKFKDIQKIIANKLEHSKAKKEATNARTLPPVATLPVSSIAQVQRQAPECPSTPRPPPPPPPRPPARAATTPKAPAIVEFYHSLAKPKRDVKKNPPPVQGNYNKPVVSSAHNSIVGEIQNRSAHLLAIRADIETKGDFINGLIQKVLAAAYTDIEDVLKFVDWLDNELSSLADERAVLKHFKWPERKADAMREAAIEYRGLKLLESEVSSYMDDNSIPCGVALKKMAGLLDKSEQSIQRLIKLRNSVILSYQGYRIPTVWMLDSGIVSKIKQASIMLAKMYMKRVTKELESIRYSERESTQEALLLQGVRFAYRAHQFAGGFDSETLCAFEEIRQRVPGHLRGSQELLAGIPS